jgi:lipopolysaccharide biosynthesis glycosyltransferase
MTGAGNGPVHVAYCVDDAYVDPMVVAARSVRHGLRSSGRPVVFHVLDGGLTAAGRKDALERLGCLGESALWPVEHPLELRGAHAEKYPDYAWWSSANLRRMHLAAALADDVERVLFLDADTVALEDVSALFDSDLRGRPLAAVAVERAPSDWERLLTLTGADRPRRPPYFNAGVLVLDLRIWREQRLSERAVEFYRRHQDRLRSLDQDTLNLLLEGRWVALDPKWNKLVQHHKRDPFGWERMAYFAAPEGIVHFGGRIKPWHAEYPDTPLRSIYRAFERP